MNVTRHIAIVPAVLVALFLVGTASPSRAADPLQPPRPPRAIEHESGILLASLANGRLSAVEIALARVIEMRREAQIANLTPVAAAFIGYFDAGTRGATDREKLDLARKAVGLAPDYPYMYFNVARVRLSQGIEGVGPAVGSLIDGLGRLPLFPRTESILAANLSFYLSGVILILFILGGFAILVRHFPLIRHDIGDLFPSSERVVFSAAEVRKARSTLFVLGSTSSAVVLSVLVAVLCFAPMLLGYGMILNAALWLAIAFPYCGRAEKAMTVLSSLIIALLPAAGSLISLPAHVEGRDGPVRWSCMREYCSLESRAGLEQKIFSTEGETPETTRVDRAVSVAAIANGRLQYAGRDPRSISAVRILLEGQPELMNSATGMTLLGNASIMEAVASCPDGKPDRRRVDAAVEAFRKAVEFRPSSDAAMRGAAVANGLAGKRDGMEKALQKVLEITREDDLDFMARIRTATAAADSCDRFSEIAGELRPPEPSSHRTLYYSGMDVLDAIQSVQPTLPFRALTLGRTRPFALPFILAGFIVFGVVMTFVNAASRRAYRCPRCRHVTCSSCNHRTSGFDYCPVCMFDQVKPAFLDPRDVMIVKEGGGSGTVRRIIVLVLSLAAPGSGQLLDGKPFRGVVMLLLLGLGLEMVLFPVPPIVDAFAYIQPAAGGLPLAPPVLLSIAYLWSVMDVVISRNR